MSAESRFTRLRLRNWKNFAHMIPKTRPPQATQLTLFGES